MAPFHSIDALRVRSRVVSLIHVSCDNEHRLQLLLHRISVARHSSGAVHLISAVVPTYATTEKLGAMTRGGTATKETNINVAVYI